MKKWGIRHEKTMELPSKIFNKAAKVKEFDKRIQSSDFCENLPMDKLISSILSHFYERECRKISN